PALREGEFPLGLCAPQLSLLDATLCGAPVPYGNIYRGRSRRTQIGTVRSVYGKLRGVDSVPIIETQRGQIPSARACHIVSRLLQLPAAVLHLQFRFDDVGMRHLPALFEILR